MLYAVEKNKLWEIDVTTGKARHLRESEWYGPVEMTLLGDNLFAVESERIWHVRRDDGTATPLKNSTWQDYVSLTSLEGSGSLFAIERGRLYRVDPSSGNATHLTGSEWEGYVAITGMGSSLYAIEKGKLWRVDPNVGKATHLSDSTWEGFAQLTNHLGVLYAIEKGQLWRIDHETGRATSLPESTWVGYASLSGFGDSLYAIENERFWRVDPRNGRATHLDGSTWEGEAVLCDSSFYNWTETLLERMEAVRFSLEKITEASSTTHFWNACSRAGLQKEDIDALNKWIMRKNAKKYLSKVIQKFAPISWAVKVYNVADSLWDIIEEYRREQAHREFQKFDEEQYKLDRDWERYNTALAMKWRPTMTSAQVKQGN